MAERVGPWFYACDAQDERWDGPFETREGAIAEGARELHREPGDSFVIDTGTKPDPTTAFDVDRIIEEASIYADDNWGEVAEDWPDVSDEAKTELTELLNTWAIKHAAPNFWVMDGGPETITVPGGHGLERTGGTEGEGR